MTVRQPAQVLVWFVVMLPLFLSAVGIAVDGQALVRAHTRAQHAADAAARAGAGYVLIAHSRESAAAPDLLDEAAGRAAALAYLREVYPDLTATVDAAPAHLSVVVQLHVTPTVLQLFGIGNVTISAHADAVPLGGISQPVN